MRVLALLLLFLMHQATGLDADLDRRLALARVAGVTFTVAQDEHLKADAIQPETRYNINWACAPDRFVPIRYSNPDARVLLQTRGGVPLVLAVGHTVVLAFDTSGSVRRWPYFNYLLYCAASMTADQTPVAFAQWRSSPVPGRQAQILYVVTGAGAWALLVVCFLRARRRGRERAGEAASARPRLWSSLPPWRPRCGPRTRPRRPVQRPASTGIRPASPVLWPGSSRCWGP